MAWSLIAWAMALNSMVSLSLFICCSPYSACCPLCSRRLQLDLWEVIILVVGSGRLVAQPRHSSHCDYCFFLLGAQFVSVSLLVWPLWLASLSLLHVLRVLLHEVPHQVQERLILIDHVRVLGLGHGLSSFGILLIVVEGLACNLEVLHEQLEVLGTLGDCLPR